MSTPAPKTLVEEIITATAAVLQSRKVPAVVVYGPLRGDREVVRHFEIRFEDLIQGDGPITFGGQPGMRDTTAGDGAGKFRTVATCTSAVQVTVQALSYSDRQRPTDHRREVKRVVHHLVAALAYAWHTCRTPIEITRSGWLPEDDEVPQGQRYGMQLAIPERIADQPWSGPLWGEPGSYPVDHAQQCVLVLDGVELDAYPYP